MLVTGVTQLACKSPGNGPKPDPNYVCGRSAFEDYGVQSIFGSDLRPLSSDSEGVSSTSEPLRNRRNAMVGITTHLNTELRQIVQLRYYRNGVITGVQTGTIIGRNTVLTAAHGFIDAEYDSVQVAFRNAHGAWVETPELATFIEPAVHDAFVDDPDEAPWAGDLALTQVPIDFTLHGITPVPVRRDFMPNRDCNDCPTQTLYMAGYGLTQGQTLFDVHRPSTWPLHGVAAMPLNTDTNIRDAQVMTFLWYTEDGDSGGPVLAYIDGQLQLVGVLGGDTDGNDGNEANDRYEVDTGEGGFNTVTVASTIPTARLNALVALQQRWQSANQHLGQGYPDTQTNYPNGTHHPDPPDNQPPEAGSWIPVQGSSSVSGYYTLALIASLYTAHVPPKGSCK